MSAKVHFSNQVIVDAIIIFPIIMVNVSLHYHVKY